MVDLRHRALTLFVATLAILLTSCGTQGGSPDVTSLASAGPDETETVEATLPTDAAREGDITGEIAVEDQRSDGREVTVAMASLEDEQGWVVIHADDGGAPGEALGHTQLAEGAMQDVVVPLDPPVTGDRVPLWAMLHVDGEPHGTYEFPGPDVPVTSDGSIVMAPFTVIVDG